MARRRRDWVTMLVSAGCAFAGFALGLSGFAVFVSGSAGEALGGPVYGAAVMLFGGTLLPAAYGLWRLEAWGWWLALLGGLGLAVAVAAMGPNKAGVAIPLVLLGFLYLLRADYGVRAGGPPAPPPRKRANRGRKRSGETRHGSSSRGKTR